MESAYLYIRVSTDDQKRKVYSLPEQEDQLLKYCAHNNIRIKRIFSENYSAKNFNRPVTDGSVLLSTSRTICKVLCTKKNINVAHIDYILPHTTNFLDRKVNSYRAISILAKHGIQIDEKEAAMILNLMYIVATSYSDLSKSPKPYILKEKSNARIML